MAFSKERVIEHLKRDEGIVCEIYLDHLGYKTVGIGQNASTIGSSGNIFGNPYYQLVLVVVPLIALNHQ